MPTAVEEPRRDDGARRSFGRRIDILDEASRLGAPGGKTDGVDPRGVDVNAGLDRGRTVDAGKGYGKVAESPDLCGEESALGRQKGPPFLQSCARLRQEWSSVREKSSWAARSTPGATRRRPSRPCRTHDRGLPAPWPGPSAPPARPTVPPAQPASRAARPTTPPAQPPRPPARRARPPTAPRRPAGWTRRTPDEARPACRHAEPALWRGRPALERGKPDPWQPVETRKLTRRNAAPLPSHPLQAGSPENRA